MEYMIIPVGLRVWLCVSVVCQSEGKAVFIQEAHVWLQRKINEIWKCINIHFKWNVIWFGFSHSAPLWRVYLFYMSYMTIEDEHEIWEISRNKNHS